MQPTLRSLRRTGRGQSCGGRLLLDEAAMPAKHAPFSFSCVRRQAEPLRSCLFELGLVNTMSKRDVFAALLSAGGILPMLERIARRPGLLVLTYHRVGSPAETRFDSGVYSATTDALWRQLRYLRANFDVLNEERLIELAGRGFEFKRPSVAITFDDGYRDNLEVATSILSDARIPAIFFIASDHVDHPRLPWWDRVAFILKQTKVRRLSLEEPRPINIDLNQVERQAAIRQLLYACGGRPDAFSEQSFFEHLEERAEIKVNSEVEARELFVSWDQVRRIRDAGMAIGSHTRSHQLLARLSETEQREELSSSKSRLEAELGAPVQTISYPFGYRQAFTETTKSLAREAGYQLGFSFYGGINRPGRTDPLDIRRIDVQSGVTFPLFRARTILYHLASTSV
jgi:peptidoglycan/xylan/chitin deacetylase (PgdA/CDA1 family)